MKRIHVLDDRISVYFFDAFNETFLQLGNSDNPKFTKECACNLEGNLAKSSQDSCLAGYIEFP